MENVQYQHMLFSRAKVVPAYLKKEQWLRLCYVFALLNASAKFCVACLLARGLEVTALLSHLKMCPLPLPKLKGLAAMFSFFSRFAVQSNMFRESWSHRSHDAVSEVVLQ